MKIVLSALAIATALAAPAYSSTVGTIGPGNDGLAPLDLPDPVNGTYGEQINLNVPGSIVVTILGWEAGYRNSFTFGTTTFQATSDFSFFDTGPGNNDYYGAGLFTWTVNNLLPGFLNFYFGVNGTGMDVVNGSNFDGSGPNTATPNFFTSYLPGFNPSGGNSALLFLDDGGGGADDNHDDLIVRLDYVPAPIPVPAGGLLLIGALGGLAALRRRKAA